MYNELFEISRFICVHMRGMMRAVRSHSVSGAGAISLCRLPPAAIHTHTENSQKKVYIHNDIPSLQYVNASAAYARLESCCLSSSLLIFRANFWEHFFFVFRLFRTNSTYTRAAHACFHIAPT